MCGEKAPVRAKVQHEINNIENLPQGIEFRVTRWRNIQKEIMLYVSGEQPGCTSKSKPRCVLGGEVGATLDRSKGDHVCRSIILDTKTIGPEHSILLIL